MVLSFPPGSTRVLVTVPTAEDNIPEDNESFRGILQFPNPSGRVTVGARGQALGFIVDNDGK